MNYFLGDMHIGHKNCLDFDNRPFASIEEHDKYIMKMWNETVDIDDDVYILGDVSWYNSTKTIEYFKQLNGNLHLIKGNHDTNVLKNPDFRKLFVEITDYKELYLDKQTSVVLCHYPIPCFKNHYYGWYHLYGHVHSSFEWNMMERIKVQMMELYDKPCNMYNVGVMMYYMGYRPRTLEEIVNKGINEL
jgi:calcineurin-like phosphoesterase family protein